MPAHGTHATDHVVCQVLTFATSHVVECIERVAHASRKQFGGRVIGRDGDLPNTLYELYERRYEVTVARAEERLRATSADADTASLLGIEAGCPLLEIDRTAFALDGAPVEWRLSLCETGAHHYRVELV